MGYNIVITENETKLGDQFQFITACYPASNSNKAILVIHYTEVGPTHKTSRFQAWRLGKTTQKVSFCGYV